MGANNPDAMTVGQEFLWPEPELVETIRAGLEAHKRSEQERNARWIERCLKQLKGESE